VYPTMSWWVMILTMIALQVLFMPVVTSASLSHVYFSVGQGWMGAAMGAAMAAVGGLLHPLAAWEWVAILVIGVVAVAGYRWQLLVDDREWLHDMIPHHSMALTTTRPRLAASTDPRIQRLAQEILITQEREIATMRTLARPYELPGGWRLTWIS
jgi:hypothetical protein